MMKRRGFLGAMLAAATAPFVMSSAIERGVLMPAPRKVWMPGDDSLLVPDIHRGAMLKIFTAAGTLLATIPMSEPRVEKFDYGHAMGIALDGGTGDVIASGVASSFELVGVGAAGNIKGSVGPGGLVLDSRHVVTGANITVSKMAFMRHGIAPEPEAFE